MTIVMGIDQHRAQITGEWIDIETGEVQRARVAPADRAGVRRFLARKTRRCRGTTMSRRRSSSANSRRSSSGNGRLRATCHKSLTLAITSSTLSRAKA